MFLDTNIVVDLVTGTGRWASWTTRTLERFDDGAAWVSNLVVVAEVAAGLSDSSPLVDDLEALSIAVVDMDLPVALRAAQAYREYRRRGGARSTILPDFLIAAHATTLGAQLMTRDRRLGIYFPELTLITPETHP